jgi:hypothetical protein
VRTGRGLSVTLPRRNVQHVVLAGTVGGFLALMSSFCVLTTMQPVLSGLFGLAVANVVTLFAVAVIGFAVFAAPVAAALATGTREVIHIDRSRLRFASLARGKRDAGPITVAGVPAGPTKISIGGLWIPPFQSADAESGWDSEAITWLVTEMARIWDQPLDDRRDRAAWRLFETDPTQRARFEWEAALAANVEMYPGFHEIQPIEPDHDADLDGLTVRLFEGRSRRYPVRITRDALELPDERIALDTIDGVRMTFGEQVSDQGTFWHVTLAIRLGSTMRVLGLASIDQATERMIGEHAWIRDRIEEAVQRARSGPTSEEGDASDVPEALRRIQAAKAGQVGG